MHGTRQRPLRRSRLRLAGGSGSAPTARLIGGFGRSTIRRGAPYPSSLSWLALQPSESTLIPVHVALPHPSLRDTAWRPRSPRDPETFADSRADWGKHGLEPRWRGDETSDWEAA